MKLSSILPAALVAIVLSGTASAQLLINECYTGQSDAIEIVNLGSAPVNLQGYRVEYGGPSNAGAWVPGTFVFGAVTIAPEGAVALVENNGFPPIAPGSQSFVVTDNINWATTGPGATRGGAAFLLDDTGAPLDAVIWLNAPAPNRFGTTFNGTLGTNGTTVGRNVRTDSDGAAGWTSYDAGTATFGALNPGQELPSEVLDLTVTNLPNNRIRLSVVTDFPPLPNAEIFNLASFERQPTLGSGLFFGIGLDAISLLSVPADPNGIFHTFTDANGAWSRTLANIPGGLYAELITLQVDATSIGRISSVAVFSN